MSSDRVIIDYFTDILCVWAWISQRRIDELKAQFGDRVEIRSQFIDVFGDTATKIETQWGKRGGYEGFAAHVASAAEPYNLAPVNPRIWTETRPTSSGQRRGTAAAAGNGGELVLIAKSSEKQGLCFSASNVRTEAAAHPSNLRMLAHGH